MRKNLRYVDSLAVTNGLTDQLLRVYLRAERNIAQNTGCRLIQLCMQNDIRNGLILFFPDLIRNGVTDFLHFSSKLFFLSVKFHLTCHHQ